MKNIVILIALFFYSMSTSAQFNFDVSKDEQTGQTMFVGRCAFDDISDEASFDWFTTSSNNYNPDAETIEQLKKVLPGCQLYVFMGTWCDDTHNLLPKLYKTMLLTHCYTNYKMYGVDRNKKSKDNEQEQFNIVNVPTIIVLRNGEELGRIVETTKGTIESDLLKITESKAIK
jgi:hypothetical protein